MGSQYSLQANIYIHTEDGYDRSVALQIVSKYIVVGA